MKIFFKKIKFECWLFLAISLLILGKMILPGYILTMDMSFAPDMGVWIDSPSSYNLLPILCLIKFLGFLMPIWLVQKLILIALFFLIGYLAWKYSFFRNNSFSRYAGAFFYLFNPFVYTRFLAGHWMLLFAYAFIPPLFYYLFRYARKMERKDLLKIFFWLLLISFFSLHLLALALIIFLIEALVILVRLLFSKNAKKIISFIKIFSIGFLVFLIFGGFWIIPNLINLNGFIVQQFDQSHWEAFSTAGKNNGETLLRVATLRGFWGEDKPWSKQFLWITDNRFVAWSYFWGLFILLVLGIFRGLKNNKNITSIFLLLGTTSFVFSCGLGESVFQGVNRWIFENLYFWRGLRDTNKISAFLVFAYSFFLSLGVSVILDFLSQKIKIKARQFWEDFIGFIILLFLVSGMHLMLGGFWGQLRPVFYPESWAKAKNIIQEDGFNKKTLFLPWHQYYSLGFNNNILSVNPAGRFFGKQIVSSLDMELLKNNDGNTIAKEDNVFEIQELIQKSSELEQDEIINSMKKYNIGYIIFSHDLIGKDNFNYEFLNSQKLKKIFEENGLSVYSVR